jgi:hypothetical protein
MGPLSAFEALTTKTAMPLERLGGEENAITTMRLRDAEGSLHYRS